MPYLFGALIGVGFFFLLMYVLPMLPEGPLFDLSLDKLALEMKMPDIKLPFDLPWESSKKEVSAPAKPATPAAAAPVVSTPPAVAAPVAPVAPPAVVAAPVATPPAATSAAAVKPSAATVAVVPVTPPAPAATVAAAVPAPASGSTRSETVVNVPPPAPVAPPAPIKAPPVLQEQAVAAPPMDAELERDPVEIVETQRNAQIAKAVENRPPVPDNTVSSRKDCGTPPNRPGPGMESYLACQWRADCLARLERARSMIDQDRRRCPVSGNEAQACQSYYRALEQQYHPALCGGGWPGAQMPGWR
ncbi:MAG: hypothetical protein HQM06_08825 [Magnetococcales bacterium]|nr:hypothetical protein [Magnetococcales bacterium]